MNFSNYIKWLNNELIPNLPDKSLLVLDNASYHNILGEKHTTSGTTKSEMVNWLSELNIQVDEKLTDPEVFELIKPLNDKGKIYKDSTMYKNIDSQLLI